jgi:hypothetical protein
MGSNPILSAILLRADALRRTVVLLVPARVSAKQDALRSFSEDESEGIIAGQVGLVVCSAPSELDGVRKICG